MVALRPDGARVSFSMRRVCAVAFLGVGLALGGALAPAAIAHSGHGSHGAADGRLPGQPDFKRVGKTTYRFNSGTEEYEVRRPGRPTAYAHADYLPRAARRESARSETAVAGPAVELPTSELAPVCRTSGNRIVVVYTHRPADETPTPSSTIRSIVKRMNWKFNDQSSQSSGEARQLKMIVDCSEGGTISVHDVATSDNSLSTIESTVHEQLGDPEYGEAVKYLVFDHDTAEEVSGIATIRGNATKSSENLTAIYSDIAIAYNNGAWTRHVTVHELLHTLGATRWNVWGGEE